MTLRLLLADDDATFWTACLLDAFPRPKGFDVNLALTPQQCREAVVGADFDVMLLDIHFDGSDATGLTLLPEIRRIKPDLKVVMFSSQDDETTRAYCARQGAHAFLSKGEITSEQLWATLEQVISP